MNSSMQTRKRNNLWIATMLTLTLTISACSSNAPGNQAKPNAGSESNQAITNQPADSATASDTTYPLHTDAALTYWAPFNPALNTVKASYNETPFYEALQQATGVTVSYTSPAIGQEKDSFNILLASGDLPDIVEWDWLKGFPGGPEKAIQDGYILKLNDAIEQWAPNLKKYLAEHPEVDKQIKTDNGDYYAFPFIRGDDALKVFQGPIIRKDWLDELGLPVPTTMEEWHTTLKAFKENKGATAPLALLNGLFDPGAFVGAYGVVHGFYRVGDEVRYGQIQPEYKAFLTTMRSWYEEGLFDQNFASIDGKTLDANLLDGATGATIHNSGGGIGKWTPMLRDIDPKAQLVGAPYPVLTKGDTPKFGQKDFAYTSVYSAAISASTTNLETAVKFLDYGYSEEGHMLMNFGILGESYTMEDGYPKYSELIVSNPDNLGIAQMLALYTRGSYQGPFVQDIRYLEQYYSYPEQLDAIQAWQTQSEENKLPPVTPSQEENAEFAAIMSDVNTLAQQMLEKIILGVDPISEFDNYVAKIKSSKIDRAIAIQQAALDRYNSR
ncbi:ABC transporter substrate-binding protein [Paenibacillus sp. 598K]|uniref:extracellular solute-binding protein n=1 Tax=Paenibacillus sp. 598K TaxID=1117987 RepID=UPI000FFB0098|nr:extracellular solute-binding protein [Paenibacillus sp. 598K]GBF74406.1 ABC transporter substrate-binding protein [Paenibacillus sp. 598K]